MPPGPASASPVESIDENDENAVPLGDSVGTMFGLNLFHRIWNILDSGRQIDRYIIHCYNKFRLDNCEKSIVQVK